MTQKIKIKEITPKIFLKGGVIKIDCSNKFNGWEIDEEQVFIGENPIRLIAVGSSRIIGEIMFYSDNQSTLPVYIDGTKYESNEKDVFIPVRLSENHVFGASPVSDAQGQIFFIDLQELQKNQQSVIYKYSFAENKLVPYISGIPAPTSLAYFEGVIFVTSMVERKLYRCLAAGEYEVFAQGLGSAFGIAINSMGEIFVGDQTGSLFKLDSTGKASFYASLPETFKGYHFTFSPDDELYISMPSNVGKNYIFKFGKDKKLENVLETMNILGGIAFSPDGDFCWIENSREEGCIYMKNKENEVRKILSASFVLGITFNPLGDMIFSDLHNLYVIKKTWIEN